MRQEGWSHYSSCGQRQIVKKEKAMKANRALYLSLAILGSMACLAKADEWDQKTTFTFSAPVEIPGKVLPPGPYVFSLPASPSDRNIIQVFNKNETQLYGTFLAIPDYRAKPSGKPIITFDERPADSPEAVKAWFYPGENYGHDFVYPKPKAVELAKVNKAPVPSMPAELAPNTTMPAKTMQEPHVVAMKTAPLKAQKPTEEEVEIAEVFVQAPPPALPDPQTELPKTASSLPLFALVGLMSLIVARGIRIIRTKLL